VLDACGLCRLAEIFRDVRKTRGQLTCRSLNVGCRTSVFLGWSIARSVVAWLPSFWLNRAGFVATGHALRGFGCLGYELGVAYREPGCITPATASRAVKAAASCCPCEATRSSGAPICSDWPHLSRRVVALVLTFGEFACAFRPRALAFAVQG
jgi:hypothetical protein